MKEFYKYSIFIITLSFFVYFSDKKSEIPVIRISQTRNRNFLKSQCFISIRNYIDFSRYVGRWLCSDKKDPIKYQLFGENQDDPVCRIDLSSRNNQVCQNHRIPTHSTLHHSDSCHREDLISKYLENPPHNTQLTDTNHSRENLTDGIPRERSDNLQRSSDPSSKKNLTVGISRQLIDYFQRSPNPSIKRKLIDEILKNRTHHTQQTDIYHSCENLTVGIPPELSDYIQRLDNPLISKRLVDEILKNPPHHTQPTDINDSMENLTNGISRESSDYLQPPSDSSSKEILTDEYPGKLKGLPENFKLCCDPIIFLLDLEIKKPYKYLGNFLFLGFGSVTKTESKDYGKKVTINNPLTSTDYTLNVLNGINLEEFEGSYHNVFFVGSLSFEPGISSTRISIDVDPSSPNHFLIHGKENFQYYYDSIKFMGADQISLKEERDYLNKIDLDLDKLRAKISEKYRNVPSSKGVLFNLNDIKTHPFFIVDYNKVQDLKSSNTEGNQTSKSDRNIENKSNEENDEEDDDEKDEDDEEELAKKKMVFRKAWVAYDGLRKIFDKLDRIIEDESNKSGARLPKRVKEKRKKAKDIFDKFIRCDQELRDLLMNSL